MKSSRFRLIGHSFELRNHSIEDGCIRFALSSQIISRRSKLERTENERGRTEKSEASKRSFPEVSLAAGYCFLSESNSPSELLKSGIPLATLIPAPARSDQLSSLSLYREDDVPQMTATRLAFTTAWARFSIEGKVAGLPLDCAAKGGYGVVVPPDSAVPKGIIGSDIPGRGKRRKEKMLNEISGSPTCNFLPSFCVGSRDAGDVRSGNEMLRRTTWYLQRNQQSEHTVYITPRQTTPSILNVRPILE